MFDSEGTVKVGYCEIEGTEFLARYRRNSLLPTPAVEEFSLTEDYHP